MRILGSVWVLVWDWDHLRIEDFIERLGIKAEMLEVMASGNRWVKLKFLHA